MNAKAAFQADVGSIYFLSADDPASLEDYLRSVNRLPAGDAVLHAEKAGEGNMNCTVRVQTGAGTFILKQSRPWLEKYPGIRAPFDRALIEAQFYQRIASIPAVAGYMPYLLWSDPAARTLALEDLGSASDYFPVYAGELVLGPSILQELTAYLAALHGLTLSGPERDKFRNAEMRALNHEHIFALPLRPDNGLDLDVYTGTPGLQVAAVRWQEDAAYVAAVTELGRRYLHGRGEVLIHGDFFPGSFLRTSAGIKVIDPEFCFCLDAEFDLGVLAAHLLLSGAGGATAESVFASYAVAGGRPFSRELARQHAGVEIMRRLLGVAQIPTLRIDLARKIALLETSQRAVLTPERELA
jgi:5-methylthioribose kinase